jgi:tetratricopeptide (TPR) repeat protein/transcriptional regulator with XRE-family HTH domain
MTQGSVSDGFGAFVRRQRIAARLTQEDLAELTGLSVRAIGDLERGRTGKPRRGSVELLRRALGLAAEDTGQDAKAAGGAVRSGQPHWPAPRQLPGTVRHFVGRADELAALSGWLDQADGQPAGTMTVSVISGTPGVGKTALAVHWAHQVAGRFPDGQLYVNLRGYEASHPVPAADALGGLLRTLGVPGQHIPPREAERAARYRSLLAGRRMLVVLDNARSAAQVQPLLPGTNACVAVVTSRDSLAGLVARDGAVRLDLNLMPPDDAVCLLRALIGSRVDTDPGAAAAMADRCCRLPLALRIAAELADTRRATPLADLVEELTDQQRRLDLLDAARDPNVAVRAVFSWSYRHLDADTSRAFRLAGLYPGPDLDRYAAAALTGGTLDQGHRLIDELARAHLIQPTGADRYGMHDLLRAYARDLANAEDSEQERRAALTRLLDYYLGTAAAAMHTLYPAESRLRPRIPPPVTAAPPVDEPAAARAWLDAQRPGLVAVSVHAADHGWPGHATRLAHTLGRYFQASGHYAESITVDGSARRAAHRAGDKAAEAAALYRLGVVAWRQGRCGQASGLLEQAQASWREIGDRWGEGRALGTLGLVELVQGRGKQAARYLQQAAAVFRETGDVSGEARMLGNLGAAERQQGRLQQAAALFRQALELSRQTGDRTGEAYALARLGSVEAEQGRSQQGARRLRQALAMFHEAGDVPGEVYVLNDLGATKRRQGCYQQAVRHHLRALALCRQTGERACEAEALNGLGESLRVTGPAEEARTKHTAALAMATEIGNKYEQAHAHSGLARACDAVGAHDEARGHWQRALAHYDSLGAPEAGQIRAQLASADAQDHLCSMAHGSSGS